MLFWDTVYYPYWSYCINSHHHHHRHREV